jgi:IS605 OrfB family transposase
VNPGQERTLQGVFDTSRFVWNQALGRWSDLWRHEQISYSYGDMNAELTDWRGRFEWLASSPVTPQRNLARKQKGSKARAEAKRQVAKVHAKVADQRNNFAHKQARTLVRSFDRIGVEKLAIKNMSRRGKGRRKAGLNRAIADAGWAAFLSALRWQAAKAGREVVGLDPRNTTQCCSKCGAKAKPRVELADRWLRCWACGFEENRDRRAARNLNPGWAVPGGSDDGAKTRVSAETRAA